MTSQEFNKASQNQDLLSGEIHETYQPCKVQADGCVEVYMNSNNLANQEIFNDLEANTECADN